MVEDHIQDRFTTCWKDISDPRAERYIHEHDITFIVDPPGTETNLRVFKHRADAKVRTFHATDQEMRTENAGRNLHPRDQDWCEATRGAKLRANKLHKEGHEAELRNLGVKIRNLERLLEENPQGNAESEGY